MTRASREEILSSLRGHGLTVQSRASMNFAGQAGLYYEITGNVPAPPPIPTSGQMSSAAARSAELFRVLALTTHQSGNREVSLIKINDVNLVHVGGPTTANIQLLLGPAIQEYSWLVHTHPLERADRDASIAHGATDADRETLARIHGSWPLPPNNHSFVLLCRGGSVVEGVIFDGSPPPAATGGRRPMPAASTSDSDFE